MTAAAAVDECVIDKTAAVVTTLVVESAVVPMNVKAASADVALNFFSEMIDWFMV